MSPEALQSVVNQVAKNLHLEALPTFDKEVENVQPEPLPVVDTTGLYCKTLL